ncbi:MAG: VOC family protein [Candidatus Dormibacteria bacterium]|jgi:catechol 2,3-dioxygenase-like lactoylglutathione lyase family enzyme
MTEKTTTQITGIGTVVVPASDQDHAIEFYVGTLGFEKRIDAPFGQGDRWVEVAPAGAATTLAIPPLHGGQRSGIEVSFNTADAEALHGELKSRGVDCDEVLRFGDTVPPMFLFRGPDGTQFRVVERR